MATKNPQTEKHVKESNEYLGNASVTATVTAVSAALDPRLGRSWSKRPRPIGTLGYARRCSRPRGSR